MTKKDKKFLDTEAWAIFRKEHESSDDRSCALLCATYLDHCLEILLIELFTNHDEAKQQLFSEMMPLGTFSAKITMAFCLNLIPESFFKDLNIIRKIRNAFAHQLHGLKFSEDPIRSWCDALLFPEDYSSSLGYTIDKTCGEKPRQKFIFTSALISSFLESHYLKRARDIHHLLLGVEPKFE